MDAYRVWLKSGKAILLNAKTHVQACVMATYQARAFEKQNLIVRGSDEWIKHTLVVKTENLSNPSSKRWTAFEVTETIEEQVSLQREYEEAIQDG